MCDCVCTYTLAQSAEPTQAQSSPGLWAPGRTMVSSKCERNTKMDPAALEPNFPCVIISLSKQKRACLGVIFNSTTPIAKQSQRSCRASQGGGLRCPRHLDGAWDEAGARRTFRIPFKPCPVLRILLHAQHEGQPFPPPHLVFFVGVTASDTDTASSSDRSEISRGPTAER